MRFQYVDELQQESTFSHLQHWTIRNISYFSKFLGRFIYRNHAYIRINVSSFFYFFIFNLQRYCYHEIKQVIVKDLSDSTFSWLNNHNSFSRNYKYATTKHVTKYLTIFKKQAVYVWKVCNSKLCFLQQNSCQYHLVSSKHLPVQSQQ